MQNFLTKLVTKSSEMSLRVLLASRLFRAVKPNQSDTVLTFLKYHCDDNHLFMDGANIIYWWYNLDCYASSSSASLHSSEGVVEDLKSYGGLLTHCSLLLDININGFFRQHRSYIVIASLRYCHHFPTWLPLWCIFLSAIEKMKKARQDFFRTYTVIQIILISTSSYASPILLCHWLHTIVWRNEYSNRRPGLSNSATALPFNGAAELGKPVPWLRLHCWIVSLHSLLPWHK